MAAPPNAALEALLAEALDDFDEDAVAPSQKTPAAPAPKDKPAPAADKKAVPAVAPSVSPEEELAKLLVEELRLGPEAGAGANGASSSAVDVSEPDADVDRTLQALAASASALADEGKSSSSGEEDAMLELLRQLGGVGEGGAGDGANVEAGVLDLLQKLSAGGDLPDLGSELSGLTSGGSSTGSGGDGSAKTASGAASEGGGKSAVTSESGASATSGGSGGGGGGSGEDAAMEGLLDNLVGQLLSKDVMHEPMRHLHAEFPKYLATHSDSLSADDKRRYMEQEKLVAQILEAYDKTPDDTDKVATLMQRMQQCGPPPPEIAGPVADGAGCVIS